MSVTPCRVHDESARVRPDGFGECLWTFVDNDIAPALLARDRCVQWRTVGIRPVWKLGDNDLFFEARLPLYRSQTSVSHK